MDNNADTNHVPARPFGPHLRERLSPTPEPRLGRLKACKQPASGRIPRFQVPVPLAVFLPKATTRHDRLRWTPCISPHMVERGFSSDDVLCELVDPIQEHE